MVLQTYVTKKFKRAFLGTGAILSVPNATAAYIGPARQTSGVPFDSGAESPVARSEPRQLIIGFYINLPSSNIIRKTHIIEH